MSSRGLPEPPIDPFGVAESAEPSASGNRTDFRFNAPGGGVLLDADNTSCFVRRALRSDVERGWALREGGGAGLGVPVGGRGGGENIEVGVAKLPAVEPVEVSLRARFLGRESGMAKESRVTVGTALTELLFAVIMDSLKSNKTKP